VTIPSATAPYESALLALATDLFGSEELARRWIMDPALGLNRRTPLEVSATPEGFEHVKGFIFQLKHGVYV
jgi:putative toxin-antitoxin system antitoxin component (TIGR02293 family)